MERYLDIMIVEGAVALDLHARLVFAAHQRIAAGDDLAVAWPDWRERPGEFGPVFRVFGGEAAVLRYARHVDPLIAARLVAVGAPRAVPGGVGRVMFFRDGRRDKFSPSVERRLRRRAAARGEAWEASGTRCDATHVLKVPSATTGAMVPLSVARRVCGNDAGAGRGSYGLGRPVPHF